MTEAIWCAASLSLCYTATCYGIDECIGFCWCMGDSKYNDSTLHIQAERRQIQWRRPSLDCCFHEDYNIMAFRMCINRFWLIGGTAITLIGFPLLHMYSWCQSSEGSELIHSIFPTSMISYQSQWVHANSACLATEGTWQIWFTGSFSSIRHLNVSLVANFVEYRSRQTKIHTAIKHPDDIVFDAAFKTKNSIVMSTSWCQVDAINLAFYRGSFIQAATGYKCWKLPFSIVFHDHISVKQQHV